MTDLLSRHQPDKVPACTTHCPPQKKLGARCAWKDDNNCVGVQLAELDSMLQGAANTEEAKTVLEGLEREIASEFSAIPLECYAMMMPDPPYFPPAAPDGVTLSPARRPPDQVLARRPGSRLAGASRLARSSRASTSSLELGRPGSSSAS